jgi:hypothetical protein
MRQALLSERNESFTRVVAVCGFALDFFPHLIFEAFLIRSHAVVVKVRANFDNPGGIGL